LARFRRGADLGKECGSYLRSAFIIAIRGNIGSPLLDKGSWHPCDFHFFTSAPALLFLTGWNGFDILFREGFRFRRALRANDHETSESEEFSLGA
jgi:hypothetical protein